MDAYLTLVLGGLMLFSVGLAWALDRIPQQDETLATLAAMLGFFLLCVGVALYGI